MKRDLKKIKSLLTDLQIMFAIQNYDKELIVSEKSNNILADIVTETDYQRIKLTLYKDFFDVSPNQQAKTLIHEFCHAIMEDLVDIPYNALAGKFITKDMIRYNEEKVASKLENVLHRLMTGVFDPIIISYNEYINDNTRQNKINKRRSRS